VSVPKLLLWLKRQGRFARAVQEGTLEALYTDLLQAIEPLLLNKNGNASPASNDSRGLLLLQNIRR